MSEYNTVDKSIAPIIFSHPTLRKESLVSGRYPTDSEKFSRAAEAARKEPTMATIRNLTPHTVNVIAEDGTIKATFPSEGSARADQIETRVGELDGIELVSMKFGATENLPAPAEGVYYIVSVITANAAKEEGRSTDDIVITADPVRDDSGRIIGCKRFALV
jgi:hypothetical protein